MNNSYNLQSDSNSEDSEVESEPISTDESSTDELLTEEISEESDYISSEEESEADEGQTLQLQSPFSSDFIKNRYAEKRNTPSFERKTSHEGKRLKPTTAAVVLQSLSSHCQEILQTEEVDESLLIELSQSQMKDMGLKIGDQLKILRFQKSRPGQPESSSHAQNSSSSRTSGRVDPTHWPKWNPKKNDLTPKEYLRRLKLAFI